jgi:hypothetical protein
LVFMSSARWSTLALSAAVSSVKNRALCFD